MQNLCKIGNGVVLQNGFVATGGWGNFFCAMTACCFVLVHRLFIKKSCNLRNAHGSWDVANGFLPIGERGRLCFVGNG